MCNWEKQDKAQTVHVLRPLMNASNSCIFHRRQRPLRKPRSGNPVGQCRHALETGSTALGQQGQVTLAASPCRG